MERIVIEVTKRAAKKLRESSQPMRKKIVALLNEALNENAAPSAKEPEPGYARPSERDSDKQHKVLQRRLPGYKKFLKRIRTKANANGLTHELLDALLK